jgi:hypothetical protein
MMRVIAAVAELQLDESPLMGPAILALTDIISEPFPGHSVIPSLCRVTYDRRLLPGETAADVLAPFAEIGARLGVQLEAEIGLGEYTAYTGRVFQHREVLPRLALRRRPLVRGAGAGRAAQRRTPAGAARLSFLHQRRLQRRASPACPPSALARRKSTTPTSSTSGWPSPTCWPRRAAIGTGSSLRRRH